MATAAGLAVIISLAPWSTTPANSAPVGQGFNLNRSDLRFILKQIKIAEQHATTGADGYPCAALLGTGPNQIPNGNQQGNELPWGLRQVDGRCNNLIPGQSAFGAADTTFPRALAPRFRSADDGTSYTQKSGLVRDAQPRIASNLIVDQTPTNPAAVEAAGEGAVPDPDSGTLFIPNVATDVGLSAPFNSWFTLFGQFFDHGLDLVTKGGGTVMVPLRDDDPLRTVGPDGIADSGDEVPASMAFIPLTRATNRPGPDGDLGTDDDVQEHTNTTTSFVDQNQTYTSHPSHQAFLREYDLAGQDTGRMLGGPTETRSYGGEGLATWKGIKEQARERLGIELTDQDIFNVPALLTDPYGNFIPGANGRPQVMFPGGVATEGNVTTPISVVGSLKTGHGFLDDIAHNATPPKTGPLTPDEDNVINPISPVNAPGSPYDNELLDAHFVAGDGRANENIGLTAVHHVFHSEHNRLVDDINNLINTTETQANIDDWHNSDGPAWSYGTRLFQAARFVTEMEYQHLVFEEFARKIQPMVNLFGEAGVGYHTEIDPSIRAEFAHTVYRFGHSMLTETIARTNTTTGSRFDIPLLDGFLNPLAFRNGGALTPDEGAGAIVMGMSRQVGNQIDEFVTDTLRNNLLGLPLDLTTINMTRGRDTGIPSLNEARRAFHAESQNSALQPYESWADFNFNLRNPGSLVNYIAAYGTHPTVRDSGPDGVLGDRNPQQTDPAVGACTALDTPVNCDESADDVTTTESKRDAAQTLLNLASGPLDAVGAQDAFDFVNSLGTWAREQDGRTTTGLDEIDLWVGGLGEKPMVFGGMLGATFNYVFEKQMEDLQDGDRFYYLSRTAGLNLLTQLEGNSFAELVMRNTTAEGLPADAFSRPDFIFNRANLGASGPILDDPATEWNENQLLVRMPDGTVRFGGGEHTVFNGTDANDRMWASEGDDTLRGNDGNDWLQAGDGADNVIGGLGDDIILDIFGDDTLKGGDGNDYISSGQGFGGDLNQGGRGSDFIVGGNDVTETFGGPGDDFVFAGDAEDTVFGDDGDDWLEGGKGPFNFLNGDNGAPFADDPNEPGHDVLMSVGGEQDYDSEGGDDVMLMGPGIQRAEGMLGFDWATHKNDPLPANSDMTFFGGLPPSLDNNRDRFDLVESLSGWQFNDVLKGDDRAAADLGTEHQLNAEGIARINGLDGILPTGTTTFNAGNIIIGGAGSDLIEGRGGDDIINGDAWLNVRLSVRDPNNPAVEIGSAEGLGKPYLPGNPKTLQQAVLDRSVNPGNIRIVREILTASTGTDTALFSGPLDEYTLTPVANGVQVAHVGGTASDGVDTITNVETLRFCDARDPDTDACIGPEDVPVSSLAAPAAPVISSVTALNGAALVTFSEPAGSTVTGFTVQAFQNGTLFTSVNAASVDTSATVTGLTNGTPYTFKVVANGLGGSSTTSEAFGPVTPEPPAPVVPGAPTIGTATGGVTSASVTWTAPASDGGATVDTYTVEVWNSAGTTLIRSVSVTAPATSTLVTGLTGGTSVKFRVSAHNSVGSGAFSGFSNAVNVASDTTAPTVSARSPIAGANGVSVNGSVVVTFSEPVQNVTGAQFNLRIGNGANLAATVTMSAANTVATLTPNAPLNSNTSYTARLVGGAAGIKDTAGNALAATQNWNFRTAVDNVAPTVTNRNPGAGATGVPVGADVVVVFSERVTNVATNTFQLTNLANGRRVQATVTLSADGLTATLNPNANLPAGGSFRVNLTNGIRDIASNRLTANNWTFGT